MWLRNTDLFGYNSEKQIQRNKAKLLGKGFSEFEAYNISYQRVTIRPLVEMIVAILLISIGLAVAVIFLYPDI